MTPDSLSSPATGPPGYFLDLGILGFGDVVMRDGDAWLHFSSPREVVTTNQLDEVESVLTRAQSHVAAGGWVVGFVAYDAAPAFDRAIACQLGAEPLAWFALFDGPPTRFWELLPSYQPASLELGTVELTEAVYSCRFESVKAALNRGDTYQVNLTLRQP